MEVAKSFRQLAIATGYSVSNLHEKVRKGQIPERGPDGWRVADVLDAIRSNVDPVRRKPVPGTRSAPNGQPNAEHVERFASDPRPDPADYRNRADLPDDFARGVLYGAHAVAHQVPHACAETVWMLNLDYDAQREAYRLQKDATFFLVQVPLAAIGLKDEDGDEPTARSPVLFLGYGPGGGTGPVNI